MMCRFGFRSNTPLSVYSVGFALNTQAICDASLQVFYKSMV